MFKKILTPYTHRRMCRGLEGYVLVKTSGRLKLLRSRGSTSADRDLSILLLTIEAENVRDLSLRETLSLTAAEVLQNLTGDVVAGNVGNRHAKTLGLVVKVLSIRSTGSTRDDASENQSLTGFCCTVVTVAVVDVVAHCS